MGKTILGSSILLALTSTLSTAAWADNHAISPVQCKVAVEAPESDVAATGLALIGSVGTQAPFDSSAAEIVSYDDCTDTLFVVNANQQRVDVIKLNDENRPAFSGAIDLNLAAKAADIAIGAANSVSTFAGLVAVAIENDNKQDNGIVALYRADTLALVTTFPAGALPDMVAFSDDGSYIAAANEGEPNDTYSVDPEGSVTLIDLQNGIEKAAITQINFRAFNHGSDRHDEVSDDVRISAPNATVAQDLEPEYLAFADNGKLYVALQENNAIAAIDVGSARVDALFGLGGKSWQDASLDASNKDGLVGNFKQYPQLEGLYMPDSIDTFTIDDATYIVTANEGDGREYGFDTTQAACADVGYQWDGDDFSGTALYSTEQDFCIAYIDEVRGADLTVDPEHPLAEALADKAQLGRLKVINPDQTLDADDTVYAFGARSFSIWDESGELVFDSGSTIAHRAFEADKARFNSTNDSNNSADDRSDDKGAEPEAITVASINDRFYVLVGLERQGGIMMFDVTTPAQSEFITYINNRHFDYDVCTQVNSDGECDSGTYGAAAGDLAPESVIHFERNGQHLVAVGNEVSGTTSVYSVEF
uniref:choice-of-anchor I family protein n=1 Tax=Thaumasiovibrio occultus TaxID=1891184 RepID=UPI000B359573|nr:choice-of-anchor I family protein [Thaumasiovibrio occultus]